MYFPEEGSLICPSGKSIIFNLSDPAPPPQYLIGCAPEHFQIFLQHNPTETYCLSGAAIPEMQFLLLFTTMLTPAMFCGCDRSKGGPPPLWDDVILSWSSDPDMEDMVVGVWPASEFNRWWTLYNTQGCSLLTHWTFLRTHSHHTLKEVAKLSVCNSAMEKEINI